MNKNQLAVVEAHKKGYVVKDGTVFNKKGKRVNTHLHPRGYLVFQLGFQNSSYPVLVHRLVAFQKYGNKLFKIGIQVRHLDCNKTNNADNNVCIGSCKDNALDRPIESRKQVARIARSFVGKYDHQKVIKMWQSGSNKKEIMKETGIMSKITISRILRQNNIPV